MPQTFANTINSNPIYADRAEKDAAGNTISTTYATKAELPTVPVTDVEVDGASVVNQGVAEITMPTVDQTYDSSSSNAQSGVAMAGALASKQDTISDLATIRSGAADGATAVQPGDLATVATTGAYSDLTGTPTIPTATSDLNNDSGFITLSDVPAQVQSDWNEADSTDPAYIQNKPTIPAALSAGNGIDITNNVVSADLDGTSLTNGANGLSVTLPVPDTTGASHGDVLSVGQNGIEWTTPSSGGSGSKFFAEAMYKSFDDSLHSLVPGMAIDYNKAYNQTLNAIVLEYSWYNNVPVFGRTVAKHLSKFADSNREIVLVSNQSQDSVDAYPVWLPCTANRDGYLTPVSTDIYLKYKNTVRFNQSSMMVNAYIADGTRSQWALRRAATVKVPMTYGLGFDDTIFEQVGDWSSITEAPVEKWVLAFRDSSNTNWITLNASTSEAYSGFCVRFPYNIFDVKVWSGNGLGINPYNGLYVTNPLPSSTSSDENKVLTVNSSGSPEWATPSGGGVTDVEVNGSSVVNASGVAEVTVPAQVQPDWDATSGLGEILNKPTIPAAQVNADWDATSGIAEILNKPTILPYKPVVAGTGVRIVDDTANNRIVVEADETVLFEDANGKSPNDAGAFPITLSEPISNFETVKIYWQVFNNSAKNHLVSEKMTDLSNLTLEAGIYNTTSEKCYSMIWVLDVSGTTVSHLSAKYNPWENTNINNGVSMVLLYKIVGIRRIANN